MKNGEEHSVLCPCCQGVLFKQKPEEDEIKCHRCGALLGIPKRRGTIKPGDIRIIKPPSKRYRPKPKT